jgi:NTE family protein
MAAELYDQILFEGKTFGDINAATAPWIIINASDIGTGDRVVFTQRFFDLLCLDLAGYRLSRAVAASSAVPGAATPISLQNRAGECDNRVPEWLRRPLDATRHPAVQAKAQSYLKYLDATERPWLHLVDGGISDNLGLRHFRTFFSTDNDPQRLADAFHRSHISDVLIISVNAAVNRDWDWAKRPEQPSEQEVLAAMTDVQMSQFTEDTKHIVRDVYRDWVAQRFEQGAPARFELVEVAFSSLSDERERAALNRIPTSLQLDEADVDLLIATGRRLLRESPEYQRFVGRHSDAAGLQHEESTVVQ